MERIEAIREKNPEKASHIEENIRWNKSFRRVEGQKIKVQQNEFLFSYNVIYGNNS